MIEMIIAGVASLVVVLVLGPFLIPVLHRLKFGQSIREEGSRSHQLKSGTPTMGGILIIIGIVLASIFFASGRIEVLIALVMTVCHGLIGFQIGRAHV